MNGTSRSVKPLTDLHGVTLPLIEPYLTNDDISFDEFQQLIIGRKASASSYPLASSIAADLVPIYDCPSLRKQGLLTSNWTDPANLPLREEFISVLRSGPGVAIFKGAYDNLDELDESTKVLTELIEEQRAIDTKEREENYIVCDTGKKHVLKSPKAFVDYYKNDVVALASGAWLGPWYQMTSQISQCIPGNKAQRMHRDYHMGSAVHNPVIHGDKVVESGSAALFPTHMHMAAHYLTLQGAIAHVDMPMESGPTKFLPYSNLYDAGYLAQNVDQFKAFFEAHKVQVPLSKGDAVFFSPSIYHGAGNNSSTSINRIANLLQVSSAFGRSGDAEDRLSMCIAVYLELLARKKTGSLTEDETWNVISSTAEGYTFPSNNRFVHGRRSRSQAQEFWDLLVKEADLEEVEAVLKEHERLIWAGY